MIKAIITRLNAILIQDEEGVSALEYAILAVMVVTAVVAITPAFHTGLGGAFTAIFEQITPTT